jgi:hypothetical protein
MAQATPDLTEFYKLARPKKPPCQIGHIKTLLPKKEAGELQAACEVDKGIINTGAIREWLAARDHEVSVAAITNHRQSNCSCGRKDG